MGTPFLKTLRAGDGFPRLDVAHISFPHALLLMTGPIRAPLGLLRAPFLANLASLSWRGAFLEVPFRSTQRSFADFPLMYSGRGFYFWCPTGPVVYENALLSHVLDLSTEPMLDTLISVLSNSSVDVSQSRR